MRLLNATALWAAWCEHHPSLPLTGTCLLRHNVQLQATYEAFMKTSPTLEAFEAELKKYMAIETEVANISPVHNIGA